MKKIKLNIQNPPMINGVFTITGIGPGLLMDKIPDEVIETIDAKNHGRTPAAKAKNLQTEEERVEACIHRDSENNVCFPTDAFKLAMTTAAKDRNYKGISGRDVLGSIITVTEFVKINYEKQITHKKVGKNKDKVPILAIRPLFENWNAQLFLEFESDALSSEQVVNLLAKAGRQIGIGAYRPNPSGGPFGRFTVTAFHSVEDWDEVLKAT